MGWRIFLLMLIFFSASNLSSQNNLSEARQLLQSEKYQEAANLCQQMIKANENAGEAYLLLGDVYFQSRKACGEGRWIDRLPAVLVYHAYEKAVIVNKELKKKARNKLRSICSYLPTREQLFNRGLYEGDKIEVDCWEMTTTLVTQRTCQSKYGE